MTPAADRLIVVSIDGVRVQEMFGGLDRALLQSVLPGQDVAEHPSYRAFWRSTPEERRRALMPFLWGTLLVDHGSIAGNQSKGSVMRLSNRHRLSYPGYAELLLGVAHDDEIDSNANRRYPHETILQVLRRRLGCSMRQVALFGSWDRFQSIPASRDDEVFTNAGFEPYEVDDPVVRMLNRVQSETPTIEAVSRLDTFTFRLGMTHLARYRPMVQWFGFGDTDAWQHRGDYVELLNALHRFDGWLRELWTWLQSQDDYCGRTALVVVTDHGRGITTDDWQGHGRDVEGAQDVWAAFAVPGWNARGEWVAHEPASQNQVAATLMSILGFDWQTGSPRAGTPLAPPG